MAVAKGFPRPLSERESQLFDDAEQAWMWFSRCQLARIAGVRFTADCGDLARPCDPDDIYRVVDRLYREGGLGDRHIAVLGRFGVALSAPDQVAGDSLADVSAWGEAMAAMTRVLRRKGIVR